MLKFKSVAPVWCAMMTNARYYEIRANVCTSPHRTPQICKYGAVSIVTPGRLSFLSASLCRIVAAGVVAVKRRRGAGFVLSPRLLVRTWPIGAKFIVSRHQTRYLSHRASLTIERSTTGCSKLRSLTLPVPTNSVVKACTTCWFSMQYASISWTISFTTQVRLYRTGYWPAQWLRWEEGGPQLRWREEGFTVWPRWQEGAADGSLVCPAGGQQCRHAAPQIYLPF